VYLVAAGFIQKFPNKDAVSVREANGQKVRDITIKAVGSQKLIRVTVWPEFESVDLGEGYYVAVEGKYSASGDNGQFHNISAARIFAAPSGKKAEREVVNQGGGSNGGSSNGGGQSQDTNPF
jgi:hypothetical protein